MTVSTKRGHRTASTAVLVVLGGAVAAATWAGGRHGLAIGLLGFYVVAGVVAWFWSGGSGDVAAIMRVGGDERQQTLDLKATAFAGGAGALAAVAGIIVESARGGDPTPYAIICAVAGFAYVTALTVLHRRS